VYPYLFLAPSLPSHLPRQQSALPLACRAAIACAAARNDKFLYVSIGTTSPPKEQRREHPQPRAFLAIRHGDHLRHPAPPWLCPARPRAANFTRPVCGYIRIKRLVAPNGLTAVIFHPKDA
jgi:hypothetical protein